MYDVRADHLVFDSQLGMLFSGEDWIFPLSVFFSCFSFLVWGWVCHAPRPSHVNRAQQTPERRHEAVNLRAMGVGVHGKGSREEMGRGK